MNTMLERTQFSVKRAALKKGHTYVRPLFRLRQGQGRQDSPLPLREAHESVVAAGGPDADNKEEDEAKQGENPTSRVERLGPRVRVIF